MSLRSVPSTSRVFRCCDEYLTHNPWSIMVWPLHPSICVDHFIHFWSYSSIRPISHSVDRSSVDESRESFNFGAATARYPHSIDRHNCFWSHYLRQLVATSTWTCHTNLLERKLKKKLKMISSWKSSLKPGAAGCTHDSDGCGDLRVKSKWHRLTDV